MASDAVALGTVLINLVGRRRRKSIRNLLNAKNADFTKPFYESVLAQSIL